VMHTLEDLKDCIVHSVDEVDLLELLDINSEDLVERFEDKIEERFEKLCEELFDDEEEDEAT